MSVKEEILSVGFDKNGQADFGVRSTVYELTYEKMKELRAMIPVAIGIMEDMWRRREQERKNPPAQERASGDQQP